METKHYDVAVIHHNRGDITVRAKFTGAENQPPRTDQEMVDALIELFENCPPETKEEIDTGLRAFGYDPNEVGRKFRAIVDEAFKIQRAKLDLEE